MVGYTPNIHDIHSGTHWIQGETETQTSGPPTTSIFPTLLPHAVTRLTLKNKKIISIKQFLIINI